MQAEVLANGRTRHVRQTSQRAAKTIVSHTDSHSRQHREICFCEPDIARPGWATWVACLHLPKRAFLQNANRSLHKLCRPKPASFFSIVGCPSAVQCCILGPSPATGTSRTTCQSSWLHIICKTFHFVLLRGLPANISLDCTFWCANLPRM